MFREYLGLKTNGEPILGAEVMSVEELQRLKEETREEMYARLNNGEVTPLEIQTEVSCLSNKWKENLDKIIITEPNGKTYTADRFAKK